MFGPGLGITQKVGDVALRLIAAANDIVGGLVFDADAITTFARMPEALFAAARVDGSPALVLTPHEGEFGRLFPDLAEDETLSKLAKTRAAVQRSQATVIYKGPER